MVVRLNWLYYRKSTTDDISQRELLVQKPIGKAQTSYRSDTGGEKVKLFFQTVK